MWKNLLAPTSAFRIINIDKENGLIVVEDEDFGLRVDIAIDPVGLKSIQISGEYEIELSYHDKCAQKHKILS